MPGKSRISEFTDVPATFATTSQKTLKRTLAATPQASQRSISWIGRSQPTRNAQPNTISRPPQPPTSRKKSIQPKHKINLGSRRKKSIASYEQTPQNEKFKSVKTPTLEACAKPTKKPVSAIRPQKPRPKGLPTPTPSTQPLQIKNGHFRFRTGTSGQHRQSKHKATTPRISPNRHNRYNCTRHVDSEPNPQNRNSMSSRRLTEHPA